MLALQGPNLVLSHCLVSITSSCHAAVLLAQAIDWSNREQRQRGNGNGPAWFTRSAAEWQAATGLTWRQQRAARAALVAAGLLHESRRDMPRRLYYLVDEEMLLRRIKLTAPPGSTNTQYMDLRMRNTADAMDVLQPVDVKHDRAKIGKPNGPSTRKIRKPLNANTMPITPGSTNTQYMDLRIRNTGDGLLAAQPVEAARPAKRDAKKLAEKGRFVPPQEPPPNTPLPLLFPLPFPPRSPSISTPISTLTPQGAGGADKCQCAWRKGGDEVLADVCLCAAPAPLRTPEFASAWAEWVEFRRDTHRPTYKPKWLVKRLWPMLASWGVRGAIDSIQQSIAQGWQGLFPPRPAYTRRGPEQSGNGTEWDWMREERHE